MVGRVVYGEARGENYTGQLAVAYTIVNRIHHAGYPNSLHGVVYQKYGSHFQYNTLDLSSHTTQWNTAKRTKDAAYTSAIRAATGALCGTASDPITSTCHATDYCARNPCSATNTNRYWTATHKTHIGHHWFVCREKASG